MELVLAAVLAQQVLLVVGLEELAQGMPGLVEPAGQGLNPSTL